MYKTKHAKLRQQQRGIKDETVDLLFHYGKMKFQNDGTRVLFFPRKIKSEMEKEHLKIKNIKNVFAILCAGEDRIITIGHRYKH
jgi:diphthamide synthase subunit DPH2